MDIAKRLLVLKKIILRRIFVASKVYNIWRKSYNSGLENIFGDLHLVTFIKINRMKWTGHENRMGAGRIQKIIFSNQSEGKKLKR